MAKNNAPPDSAEQSLLSEAEKKALVEKYHGHIERIRPLNETEQLLLTQLPFDVPRMSVQRLYILKSNHFIPPVDSCSPAALDAYSAGGKQYVLTPLGVEQQLRRFLLTHPLLRTSYYQAADNQYLAVECDTNLPLTSLTFQHLNNPNSLETQLEHFMLADRHCPFLLDEPFLPRLKFYAISKQEYAVLVSQPLILAGRWDIPGFLTTLLHADDITEPPTSQPSLLPADYLPAPALSHLDNLTAWQTRLQGVNLLPRLPGYTRPLQRPQRLRVDLRQIEGVIFTSLQKLLVNDTPAHWIALLNTLWGITLLSFSQETDVCFPVLLPEPGQELTADKLHYACCPMPARIQVSDNQTLQNTVARHLQEILEVATIGLPTREEFTQLTSLDHLYNHIISFQNFDNAAPLNMSEKSGINASATQLGSLADDLRLTFHREEFNLCLDVTYYEEAIDDKCVYQLLTRYIKALELAPHYWHCSCKKLIKSIQPHLHTKLNIEQHALLSNLLSKCDLFTNLPFLQLNELSAKAFIYELPCYEVVQTLNSNTNRILLILSGQVMRQRLNSEGWLVPLNIAGPGELVNELSLLDETTHLYAEVISEKAILVAIPHKSFFTLLHQSNDFSTTFTKYLLRQLDTCQRLWLTT